MLAVGGVTKAAQSLKTKLGGTVEGLAYGLGGTGGAVFAWLLIGTLHLDTVLPLIKEYHLLGA